ncbi:MAG: glycosyltransferase family 2 protein [Candidatus Omnitrophica bacterium]|nr:glycosyltransferase family 2 protein [Candidatus Omnitrophota bacterium]
MKLSVIISVYNEKNFIAEILKRVEQVPVDKEIIVIDDGSTDGTKEILEKLQMFNVTVLYNSVNHGKGYSIRKGLEQIKGDIVLIQDADLEYDPDDYQKLIEPIISGKAAVVYGSRALSGYTLRSDLFNPFCWGRWLLSFLTNVLYGANITDEPCGYKVFKTEVIKGIPLVCERFEFCPEVTAKVLRRGYKIYEVPACYNPRSFKEGKKISWRDGLEAIITLFKYRWWK